MVSYHGTYIAYSTIRSVYIIIIIVRRESPLYEEHQA